MNPERTPSGYRKFYEHDVERLRWVLRQQREHFLPLKVIKDRLEEDADSGAPAEAAAVTAPDPAVDADVPAESVPVPDVEVPVVAPESAEVPEPVLVGQRAPSGTATAAADATGGLPGIEAPAARVATPAPVERAHGASLSTQPPKTAGAAANGSGNGSGTQVAHAPAAKAARPSRAAAAAVDPPPASPAAPSPAAPVGSGGASLSLDELCAASGLRAEYVGQLQEYGLLRATMVGGGEYFDEEALTVANVAASFAAYGVEARHLRLYKNAADREAGFVEQIVIPMVRQRNPEARTRAALTADELAGLGQQLVGSLLRTALGDLLNG